jgi:hypothetical protein
VTAALQQSIQENQVTKDKIKVIGIIPKPNGNYVVTFTADSPIPLIENNKNLFLSTLAEDRPNSSFTKDEPWTRIIVHNIPQNNQNNQPRTEESLLEAVKLNPAVNGVKIT